MASHQAAAAPKPRARPSTVAAEKLEELEERQARLEDMDFLFDSI